MKPIQWFISIMLFYFVVRYMRLKAIFDSVFINFHLTDLLFVPAMCLFALIALRWIKRDDTIVIKPWMVFLQILLVSLYFEWFLPNFKTHIHPYTADHLDVMMYLLGGVIFLFIQRKMLL